MNEVRRGRGRPITPISPRDQSNMAYIRANRDLLNLSAIARHLELDVATMHLAVHSQVNHVGARVIVPARCRAKLAAVVARLRGRGQK